jgi:hypothetical protein
MCSLIWIAECNHSPDSPFSGDAERNLDNLGAILLEGGDVAAETVSLSGEQQAFDKTAIVKDFKVVPVSIPGRDNQEHYRCAGRRPGAESDILCFVSGSRTTTTSVPWMLLALADQRPTSRMSESTSSGMGSDV